MIRNIRKGEEIKKEKISREQILETLRFSLENGQASKKHTECRRHGDCRELADRHHGRCQRSTQKRVK